MLARPMGGPGDGSNLSSYLQFESLHGNFVFFKDFVI